MATSEWLKAIDAGLEQRADEMTPVSTRWSTQVVRDLRAEVTRLTARLALAEEVCGMVSTLRGRAKREVSETEMKAIFAALDVRLVAWCQAREADEAKEKPSDG